MDESLRRSLCFRYVGDRNLFQPNLEHTGYYPALVLAERPALANFHLVSHMALVRLVMRFEPTSSPDETAVKRMAPVDLDGHHYSLVHLVADHLPDQRAAAAGLSRHFPAPLPTLVPVGASRCGRYLAAPA